MEKNTVVLMALALLAPALWNSAKGQAQMQTASTPYVAMAPLGQYLIADEHAEIALARSAAPASISGAAEVLVLGPDGYKTAATGTNGFVCLVERSFGAATDFPEFWNPKISSPICVNPPAARTYLPGILLTSSPASNYGRR